MYAPLYNIFRILIFERIMGSLKVSKISSIIQMYSMQVYVECMGVFDVTLCLTGLKDIQLILVSIPVLSWLLVV